MKAVLTGDIINSRKVDPSIWITALKTVFNEYGTEPKTWEIFRGDSFQLIVDKYEAIKIALIIKSTIKINKTLDVKISIGIGNIDYESHKISESNGSAFVNSGEQFEALKKHTLAIKTNWKDFDQLFNVILQLVMSIANHWTPTTAEIIKAALENQQLNQSQIAERLNKKSQSTISASLKRGGYEEIMKVIDLYKIELKKLC